MRGAARSFGGITLRPPMKRALLAAAALAVFPAVAPAAQQMRPDARPAAGALTPRADSPAEQLQLTLRARSETGMDDCSGFVDPSAPDATVEWPGGTLRMTVRSDFDATLAVHGPDGVWHCNDDGDGLAPVLDLVNAPAGRYAVWVGSYSDGVVGTATLVAGAPPPVPVFMPDAEPGSGRLALAEGFEAQSGPAMLAVRAGGSDSVSGMDIEPAASDYCVGYVDAMRPTMAFDYTGSGDLALSATSGDAARAADDMGAMSTDLVMVVHTPGGVWRCNDDFLGVDPGMNIEGAETGRYAVWVGTYGAGEGLVDATVTVSESFIDVPDFSTFGGYERTPYAEGRYLPLNTRARAAVRLRVGRTPVSGTARVTPEGRNPVVGPSCSGFIAATATATVEMRGAGPFGITATAEDGTDLVLVVQTPDGNWFCSDDADGLNPGIQFGTAENTAVAAGTYRAWVGTLIDPDPMQDTYTMGMDTMSMDPMANMDDMAMNDPMAPPTGPTRVTVTAARGEITVSTTDFDMDDMGIGRSDFYEGQYAGQDLTPDNPVMTLTLDGNAGQTAATAGSALVNPVDGDGCRGLIDARPTLAFTAGATPLSVRAASGDTDLVMVARAPSGRWFCSDDASGSDPRIETDEAGRYAVWVGTYSRPAAPVQVQVSVSVE